MDDGHREVAAILQSPGMEMTRNWSSLNLFYQLVLLTWTNMILIYF